MQDKTGRPAFPSPEQVASADGKISTTSTPIINGRTAEENKLRDWFAGMALTGVMREMMYSQYGEVRIAEVAYIVADAILKERVK